MKKLFIMLLLLVASEILPAQNPKDFNGWEFLEWNTEKKAVKKILKEKGFETDLEYSETKFKQIIGFQKNALYTWFRFDSLSGLDSVHQYKEFSVVGDKEAKLFFEKTKKELIEKYSKPVSEKDDKEKQFITIVWKLKFTEIVFTYDYQYKVIDELGCCSYRVETVYKPLNTKK